MKILNRSYPVVFCCFLLFILSGYEGCWAEEARWQKAQAAFDAKLYPQAEAVYLELLKTKLTPAQLAALKINMATVAALQGNWKEAMSHFNEVQLGEDPDPQQLRRLKTNAAFTLIDQAGQLVHVQSNERLMDKLQNAFVDLSLARGLLIEAATAEDKWSLIEDGKPNSADIDLLKEQLQATLLALLNKQEEYLLKGMTSAELATYLALHMHGDVNELELLAVQKVDDRVSLHYLEAELAELRDLGPQWKELRRMLQEPQKQGLGSALFFDAEKQWMNTQDLLREKNLWKARLSEAKSLRAMALLVRELSGKDPFEALLEDRVELLNKLRETADYQLLFNSFQEEYRYLISLHPLVDEAMQTRWEPEIKESPLLAEIRTHLQKMTATGTQEEIKAASQDLENYRKLTAQQRQKSADEKKEDKPLVDPQEQKGENSPEAPTGAFLEQLQQMINEDDALSTPAPVKPREGLRPW